MNRFKDPNEFLRYFGVSQPDDIHLMALAKGCDATIKYKSLTGCEAYIIGLDDNATIFVSNEVSRTRQRFCVGHELGHWMLDRGTPRFSCKTEDIGGSKKFQKGIEARANRYAADLLMPKFLFEPACSELEMSLNSARKLAKIFRTSLMATAIRLVEHGSFPAMFAWYSMKTGKRISFIPWPDLPQNLWPSDEIHHETYAIEVLCGKTTDTGGPRRVSASSWFNTRNAYDHDIYEHTVRGYGDNLLTMLWWKNEDMLEELF